MSFTGDLEHLPIVDVIQLLHATRKSGTLDVRGRRGECQLIFKDGYIVSANHARSNVRIGQVLIELQALTDEILERALQEQKSAGANRKPLIATLIEGGHVKKEDAFRGLQALIEMTIVEILTWPGGTFSLDVDQCVISDEYRYFPEKLHEEFLLNTQNILMDALRIYDEKKRDGELDEAEEDLPLDDIFAEKAPPVGAEAPVLSADDLGLADLDQLEAKIPGVFSTLVDADPGAALRRKLRAAAADLSPAEEEALLACLESFGPATAREPALREGAAPRPLVFFSPDALLRFLLTNACRDFGFLLFATDDPGDLKPIIEQSLARNVVPLLVFDRPGEAAAFSAETLAALRRQKRGKYPHLPMLQLASAFDYAFSLQALSEGGRTLFPRPVRSERPESFAADTIRFLETFCPFLQEEYGAPEPPPLEGLLSFLAALAKAREAPEAASALLQLVAESFPRALTLIVGPAELVSGRAIGIGGKNPAEALPPKVRLSLAKPSLLRRLVEDGSVFYGASEDPLLTGQLLPAIGSPAQPTILLLPMKCRGRVVSLIYADFGAGEISPIRLDLLEAMAGQAGLVLENAFYRKKLAKAAG